MKDLFQLGLKVYLTQEPGDSDDWTHKCFSTAAWCD